MSKVSNKQLGIIFGGLFLGMVIIKVIVGSSAELTKTVTSPQMPANQFPVASNEPVASSFAALVKSQLQKDLTSVDVHLSAEGSLRWLFIVVSYPEWKSFNKEGRRERIESILRQMKDNYPRSGLKVSVGASADQQFAEADWGLLSDGPSVRLVGE